MSKRMIWALVATAVFLAVALAAYGLPPQEICEPAKQIGQEQCAAYRFPLFLAIKVGEFLDLHNGLIIAVFTGTLWWSTTMLWSSGERQLTHSKDTAKKELRAYVGFLQVTLLDRHGADPQLEIVFQNFGKTPAADVTVRGNFNFAPPGAQSPAGYAFIHQYGTVEPGQMQNTVCGIGATNFQTHAAALTGGQLLVHLWARVTYSDIYGQNYSKRMVGHITHRRINNPGPMIPMGISVSTETEGEAAHADTGEQQA